MGREVRKVPAEWQHPTKAGGRYIPLFGGSYSQEVEKWDKEAEMWAKGKRRSFDDGDWVDVGEQYEGVPFEEWAGKRPRKKDYMPDWPEEDRTHYMMYENTSEGTPISPAFETPEELARWLADNNASAFAYKTATYEQWLRVCRGGYAPSAMYSPDTGLVSGVEGIDV